MKRLGSKWQRRINFILILFYLIISQNVKSEELPIRIPRYHPNCYAKNIKFLYKNVLTTPIVSYRIEKASLYFKDTKYLKGALGEGVAGVLDKSPLCRTDAFDCLTFVSTVLALAYAQNYSQFLPTFKKIQYRHGYVSYFTRHHFTEVDWNFSNERLGYLQDITDKLSSNILIAKALVNKPEWFKRASAKSIKCFSPLSIQAKKNLLYLLHEHANKESKIVAYTTYIPLSTLIKEDHLLMNIPSGSVVEIIDKTRPFEKEIGTDLNIAHLGFVIQTSNETVFRHASKVCGRVVDVPFSQYLKRYYQLTSHPERIGIHIEGIPIQ